MRHNKCLTLITVALVITIMSGASMFVPPVEASKATYQGSGDSRTILERANNATTGSSAGNKSALNLGLPLGSWKGYQMATSFTNLLRNADYAVNGQFSGSRTPWTFSPSTSYISGNWTGSPPSGTATGANYVRLQGNTSESSSYLANQNFNSSAAWTAGYGSLSGYGYPISNWVSSNGGEWQERDYYYNPSYYYARSGSAELYCDQYFTYSGSVPPRYASLSYKFYVSEWTGMSGGSMSVKLILTRYPPGSGNVNNTIFTYQASGITSKPSNPINVDITSYIVSTGLYRVRLYASISLVVPRRTTSAASVIWDDVGVYIKYGSYSPSSYGQWYETWNPGQPATADGILSFKYWTNTTTLVPSSDSYISAWVGSNQYNIIAFSSITQLMKGSWQTATLSIPKAAFDAPSVTIKLGVYAGSNLQIPVGSNPRFYFDNVTFFIKYKPTPASVKLGVEDILHGMRWDATGSAGSGSLTITPSTPWSSSPVQFEFVTNATGVTFSYTSTMYASGLTQTDYCTFTVHDDTRTTWYLNYSTPTYIGGYQNYNVSVYIPADWLSGGLVSQIRFGGIVVTNYATASVNSSTWVIKIPASVFVPNPPSFLLEMSANAPNYVGPSSLRTLLFTQGNTTNNPGPNNWINATSFRPKNITRLVCYVKDGSGGIPLNVALSSAMIRLYNASSGKPTSSVWSVYPNSNGFLNVTLSPWADENVTYFDGSKERGTSWYFCVNWTNRYETANGIAAFSTNSTLSVLVPTTLTSPGQPYTATYYRGFTLVAFYRDARTGANVPTPFPGIQGMYWNWNGSGTPQSMARAGDGTWSATITGPQAYQHYAPQGTWIQLNATKSGYVSQSIMVRVFVRDELTTGSAPPFPVPYANYAWNSTITTYLTYLDADNGSSAIVGAKLYLDGTWGNATKIGLSGMVWWYKDLGNGTYRMFIKGNATAIGTSTWSFTVKVNKTHYNVATFGLNGFNIRDRLTTYSYYSLSVIKPWNDSAIFMITYRDLDGNGIPPIYGATPSCTWRTGILNKDYFVMQLGNWTYQFSLNVTGLAPGTYSCSFGFSKTHYAAITTISAQVTIQNIHTSLTSLTPQMAVSWVDNTTVVLVYKDIDHDSNISLASWDEVKIYDKYTLQNYTLQFIFNIYLDTTSHLWNLRINGSLPIGDYTLLIHCSVPTANGYYNDGWLTDSTLSIGPLSTSLVQHSTPFLTPVVGDAGRIVVNYTDRNGRPILDASVGVFINDLIYWDAYENGSGIYTIYLYTTNVTITPSYFSAIVHLSKGNYATGTISLSGTDQLAVIRIKTALTFITNPQVAKGLPANYTVQFWDTSHNLPILDASISLIGVDQSHWSCSELGNGSYAIILQTDWIAEQGIDFQVSASKTNYEPQLILVPFKFQAGGLSLMMVVMIGGGSSGAVIIAVLGYVMYRKARVPFFIKKIDQSIKLISKGEMPQRVPMRTRTQVINSIIDMKLAVMSKEKLEQAAVKKKKVSKEAESGPKTLATQPAPRGVEIPAESQAEVSDVELVAKELEKLEGKEDESEMIKRELDELDKRSKSKKGESD